MNSTASRRVLFTVLFSLSAALGARAQISNVWNGGGADNNWTNGLNWVGGVAPANPSTNFVTLAGATRLTPAVNAGWTVLGLSIATNAGAFTQSGSNLTITGNAPGGVGPNIFVHSGPTNVVINNTINLPTTAVANRRTMLISNIGSATFNGTITNSDAGGGSLFLRGLGAGSGTLNGPVGLGTNFLFKTDTATWILGSSGNVWGLTDMDSTGTLRIAIANGLPTNTLVLFETAGPRLDMSNFNQTVVGLAGTGVVRTGMSSGGILTISDLGATNLFAGNIVENGSLVKTGPGRFILSATNNASTFTGNVTVASGVLQAGVFPGTQYVGAVGGNPGLPGLRTVFVNAGALLDLEGRDIFGTNIGLSVSGSITNNGFNTLGPLTLNGALISCGVGNSALFQNYALAGDVTVTGVTASTIAGSGAANSGIHLQKGNGVTFNVADVTGDANPDLIVSAILTNISNNAGAGSLTKTGAGTMRLDANNSFSGTATVNGGTLALGAAGSVSNATVSISAGAIFNVTAIPNYPVVATEIIQGNGSVTGVVAAQGGARIFPGAQGVPGTLTMLNDLFESGGVNYTNVFDLTNDFNAVGSGTNDLLVVNGTFEPISAKVLINPLVPLPSGSYRLINYGAGNTTTFTTPVLGNTTRGSWTLDASSTIGQISVIVSAGTNQSLIWNPIFAANWNFGVTANWTNPVAGAQDVFYDLDSVLFNDLGAASNTVTLTSAFRPAVVAVDSTSNYTFTGGGKISDYSGQPATLTKNGTGKFSKRSITAAWLVLSMRLSTRKIASPRVSSKAAIEIDAVVSSNTICTSWLVLADGITESINMPVAVGVSRPSKPPNTPNTSTRQRSVVVPCKPKRTSLVTLMTSLSNAR